MHFLKLTEITENFKEEEERETILISSDKIVSVKFNKEENTAILILVDQRNSENDWCVTVDLEEFLEKTQNFIL